MKTTLILNKTYISFQKSNQIKNSNHPKKTKKIQIDSLVRKRRSPIRLASNQLHPSKGQVCPMNLQDLPTNLLKNILLFPEPRLIPLLSI